MPQSLGVAWCTYFDRSGNEGRSLRMRNAYRAPSLFTSKMRANKHIVEFLVCDEELGLSDLDGTSRTLQDDVEILYIMTHGVYGANGYEALLNDLKKGNWLPSVTGIGQSKLVVAVFDTCNLIDPTAAWQSAWATNLGTSLRLLLGFEGLAAIDRGEALRGGAFAEALINGKTFADAWIQAVHSTTGSQYSKAVAIGIGDSPSDALNILNTACLSGMPAARAGGAPFFCKRP